MNLKELLGSFSVNIDFKLATDKKTLRLDENEISIMASDLLESGNAVITDISPFESGFSEIAGGPLVSGSENKFIGFTEIVKFPKDIYFPLPIAFDVNLDLTIHSLESIIYRLVYGGNGGLGLGRLIGGVITPETLLVLQLRIANLLNDLSFYGYKEENFTVNLKQSDKDPTVIIVEVNETLEGV